MRFDEDWEIGVERQGVKRHFLPGHPYVLRLTLYVGATRDNDQSKDWPEKQKDAHDWRGVFLWRQDDAFYAIVADTGKPSNGGVGYTNG